MNSSISNSAKSPQDACLSCTDCKGLCYDLLMLVVLPDTVLRRTVTKK